jgi:hypothetical protein
VDRLGHGERLRDEKRGTLSQTYSRLNCMRHPSIAGLLVMKPNSVASLAAEAKPVTFWTQKEAQVCVDTLNDIDQLGSV